MSAGLFSEVDIVATVGDDFPREYIDFLRRKKVNLDALSHCKGESFSWEGEYEGDMNSAVTKNTHLGVLLHFKPAITNRQKDIKHVFLGNIDPDLQAHLLDQVRSPKLVAMDSMNFWIDNKRKSLLRMFKRVNIYVANDQEARSLTGETNLVKAAKALSRLGPPMVLIKKGEHGTLFCARSILFALPAYPVEKVIDPTGAGDTFAGGFMGSLSRAKRINEAGIKRAVALGTIAASFNVEGFGVERTARLTVGDMNLRLKQFRKYFCF
jgi:sugar/nucleoside kinase (ribokinase family)